MTQQRLNHTSSHRIDPASSYIAEEQHTRSGRRQTHQRLVEAGLFAIPGAVATEIATITGLDVVEVRRRLDDLRKAGRAEQGTVKRRTEGHPAQVTWWLVKAS